MNSTELIKEALESYNNYEDGKFEKKSYMNGYYDARLKVSQMQLPVKPVDYGTCKNCIFNLETDENSLVSECQLTIDEFTGIGLQFSRDFGCNQWQSKPSV